jgi:hypothetical protein
MAAVDVARLLQDKTGLHRVVELADDTDPERPRRGTAFAEHCTGATPSCPLITQIGV